MSKKGPRSIARIPSDEFDLLIQRTLKYTLFSPRRDSYDIYSMSRLRSFLDETIPGCRSEGDAALQLMNLERAWRDGKSCSTFGYVYGDLRLPEGANTSRICSQNFYLDDAQTVWLIDPKTGRIYRPPNTVEAHLVII